MKYKEFRGTIKTWGEKYGYVTEVGIDELYTEVRVESNGELYSNADISNVRSFVLDIDWIFFGGIEEHARKKLFDILVDLARTPLEEREPVKKYYLKHKFIKSLDRQTYLTKNEKYFWLTTEIETDEKYADYQQFTLAEIENIEEKFGVTLEDWELVEVE